MWTMSSSIAPTAGSSRLDDSQTVNQQDTRRRTAMFSDIELLHIGVGNFNQNIYNRDDNMLKHLAQSLPRSRDAAFSAAINLDNLARRHCSKGTRVEIIAQIMAWVNEKYPTQAPPIYWLTGLAGLGKTTIAYTICKLLKEARTPFVSFFCSRQLDSRNSKLIVTTLCRDLAELYNSYAANVSSVLETNSNAVDAGLRIQLDELLAKPWQTFITQHKDRNIPTPIVVVDALDESDRGTEFLEELLRLIHQGQLAGIKFLVTSRHDPKIADICKSFPPNAVCKLHEVHTANVQKDIEKYLREALPELKDEPELALLSQRAGGFFIYATTAVRFISPPHSPPSVSEMRSHLQAMLDPDSLTSHAGSDERLLVDELYERILGDAFRDTRVRAARLRILHAIVCAESRIGMSVLADLTNTDQDTVKRVVESLHAVLFVSPKDGCIYWYHVSFRDFVFSQARAKITIPLHRTYPTHHVFDVFCDAPAYHGVFARWCFSVMQESLHFNMCNLPSSYLFDSGVPGLSASIDKTFSPTLRYVSRHWARHLLWAKNDNDDLLCGLKDFLDNKLLFWIEAMNLIGAKFECSSLLKDAETWLKMGKPSPDLLGKLTDATHFSAFFAGSPASESTPHLYISALPIWNQDSAFWRHWRSLFGFIPSISLPRDVTAPLLTIPTTPWVTCVAFSPGGDQIVSGSYNKLVQVWDAVTGAQMKLIQGNTGAVTAVAFSPDGDRIVSGCGDGSVRVWGAKTGKQLGGLQGHTDRVTSVAFSSNGNRIISGSSDRSVRVWDAETSEQLWELQGHTDSVVSVAFSHNDHRILSGSYDESVRVWDATTGEQLKEIRGHTGGVIAIAERSQIFSFDGKSVRVWDPETDELLRELRIYTPPVTLVAFHDNQAERPQYHTDVVLSVAFSSDVNHRIVSGSGDKSVRVWDSKTGEQLMQLQGHTSSVSSVAFSPDGRRIVSGSYDRTMRVWDAGKTSEQQGSGVTSVTFSPDGNRIASSSSVTAAAGVWPREKPWSVHDGWILSGTEMLVWVPSTICNVLLCPHSMPNNTCRNGSATISFTQRKLGTLWHGCYTP